MPGVCLMLAPKRRLALAVLACGAAHGFAPSLTSRRALTLARHAAPKYKGESAAPWSNDGDGAATPAAAEVVDVEDLADPSFEFMAKVSAKDLHPRWHAAATLGQQHTVQPHTKTPTVTLQLSL